MNRIKIWTLGALVVLLSLSACNGATPTPAPATALPEGTAELAESINVTRALGLDETIAIDVLESVVVEADEGEGQEMDYALVARVSDREIVARAVEALDTEVEVGERSRCMSRYLLVFHQEDGTRQTMGYACFQDGTPFLRGRFQEDVGQDAVPPQAFVELMDEILADVN
ncbi:MAG: hypothetical protein ACLFU8_11260 [Anaerolineales bacterium]